MENQEDDNSNVLDQVEESYQDQQAGGKENNGPTHGSATGGRSTNSHKGGNKGSHSAGSSSGGTKGGRSK